MGATHDRGRARVLGDHRRGTAKTRLRGQGELHGGGSLWEGCGSGHCQQPPVILRTTLLTGSHKLFHLLVSITSSFSSINIQHTCVYTCVHVLTHTHTHTHRMLWLIRTEQIMLVKTQISLAYVKEYFTLDISDCSPTIHASAYWNHFSVLNLLMKAHWPRLSLTSGRLNPMTFLQLPFTWPLCPMWVTLSLSTVSSWTSSLSDLCLASLNYKMR